MDAVVVAAIVTAIGGVAVIVAGWVVNKRLGIPSAIQAAIAEERKQYEAALERRNKSLEDELQVERQAREHDKQECAELLDELRRDLDEAALKVGRLEKRLLAVEEQP